ncbi:hypothetical protein Q763_13400 [Flavobacterium beibuense F44-8]|uniref:Uncharacterized protein n=1 Tax=Flavobacterium beibuense F44-8 TaxID=1406840 RepID=A0A0A2LTN6_9FLAO|nr:hypothetical protein [Flavobacterium beibuense]KGO79540.1 hypothetical protein Q763_13400 [Flavobacterium beibuense F44-8]
MNQQKKKNKIAAFVAVFMGSFVAVLVANMFRDNPEKKLADMVTEINKECPVKVDRITMLDSTVFEKDPLSIEYYYTLDVANNKVNLKEAKNRLEVNAQKGLDTDDGMEAFRKHNVDLNYNYSDNEGNKLFDFSIKHK